MKIATEQTANRKIERLLTTVYGTGDKVAAAYKDISNVNYHMIGAVPPLVHIMIPISEEVGPKTPLIFYRTIEDYEEKLCKQLKPARLEHLELEVKHEGNATNYVISIQSEFVGYIRRYAGITTFCSPSVKKFLVNLGGYSPEDFVARYTESNEFNLIYLMPYEY